jgi:hypothetical protein
VYARATKVFTPDAQASANDKTNERVGRQLSVGITSLRSGPTPGRTAEQLGLRVHRSVLLAPPRPLAAGAGRGYSERRSNVSRNC